MKSKALALFFLLAISFTACSGDSGDGVLQQPDEKCDEGTIQVCVTECDSVGKQTCTDEEWTECTPPEEKCGNSTDDDCDGDIDEGCENVDPNKECEPNEEEQCAITENNCTAVGSHLCGTDGKWGECDPPVEVCDNRDNDCDGKVDEDLSCDKCDDGQTQLCQNTCGLIGERKCEGVTWGPCVREETCNNMDDDCDGNIDQNVTQKCESACGEGEQICVNGKWSTCDAQLPKAEECNGKDDDCDGKKDEDEKGEPLTGECENECGKGTWTCSAGKWGECSAKPTTEVCDNEDNDCDGTVDNVEGGCSCTDGESEPCGTDLGMCHPGTKTCVNGQWGECGGELYVGKTDEVCDGQDNDCDGTVDEGDPQGGAACGTANINEGGSAHSPCQLGIMKCVAGQLQCVGGKDPTPELCDEIDNNCDGLVDNDVQPDQYEPNNKCSTAHDLGMVVEDQGPMVFQASLFTDMDVDWFLIKAKELTGGCFPGTAEGPYYFIVDLKDLPKDYDLCVYPKVGEWACGDVPDEGSCWYLEERPHIMDGILDEQVVYEWDGSCGANNDVNFYIKIVNYEDDAPFDCTPYTLSFEFTTVAPF